MSNLLNNNLLLMCGSWVAVSILSGLLIWVLLKGYQYLNPDTNAKIRYQTALVGLVSLFVITLTFTYLWSSAPFFSYGNNENSDSIVMHLSPEAFANLLSGTSENGKVYKPDTFMALLAPFQAILGVFWLIGVLVYGIKFFGGFVYLKFFMKDGCKELSPFWKERIGELKTRLKIKRKVKLMLSSKVKSPLTFGLFKPVILFPLGFFTTLPADQIEAIILHELYHIKHRDYLINILVMSLQVIFFYHPLVWKLTKILEEERENLRDDAVIEYTRNPFTYAKALLNVEELIDQPTRMSLYFSKEPSQLNKRIMRILDKNPARKSSVKPFLSLIILAFFMMSFSWLTLNESKSDKSMVFEAGSAAKIEINSNSQDLNNDNFDLSEVKSGSTTFFQQIQNLYPNAGLEALTDPAVFMNGKKVEQSANVHELIDVEKNNIIKAYLPSVVPDEYKMYAKRGVVLIKNEEPVADLVAVSKTEEVKVEKQVQEEQSKSSTSVERPLMFRTMRIATNIGPIEEEHAVEEPISSTDSILVVVDEEILGFGLELVEDLSPENIEKITVLKDENAVAKYGERAKKGVIEITTKITIVEIWGNLKFKVSDKYPDSEIPPYFVLDGEPIKKSKLKKINPEDIKHINVLKGETAIEKYGDKGKNGVIEITSKKK